MGSWCKLMCCFEIGTSLGVKTFQATFTNQDVSTSYGFLSKCPSSPVVFYGRPPAVLATLTFRKLPQTPTDWDQQSISNRCLSLFSRKKKHHQQYITLTRHRPLEICKNTELIQNNAFNLFPSLPFDTFFCALSTLRSPFEMAKMVVS